MTKATTLDEWARRKLFLEHVTPEIDSGLWPVKRVVGDPLVVEADIYAEGHDVVRAELVYRKAGGRWLCVEMEALGNDRFRGRFIVDSLSAYEYKVRGWVDEFATWARDLKKKIDAEVSIDVDLRIGAKWVSAAAERAKAKDKTRLHQIAAQLALESVPPRKRCDAILDDAAIELVARYPDRDRGSEYPRTLRVTVHPQLARFSSWYEMFPRSCGPADRHGTFADAAERLTYVADMGFDILYLPPIHPIGKAHRKGKNNTLKTEAGDPGSPWAIGSAEGGHTEVHPELGTLADFDAFLKKARSLNLEIALDIAFQASPDHPWVREHPQWFRARPDGTIQYAENPPKKYQDIYPLDFDTQDWQNLWRELLSVFEFWIERGVKVFRVDNPHTKALRFWGWCLDEIYKKHPDVIFLSEAFTRPRLMYGLAKLGFTQSYTYFTWRESKAELTEYMNELLHTEVAEYFCPNFWPNTPDILPEHLKHAGRPMFVSRLVLASMLSSSFGLYGPAYELMDNEPRPDSGEYWDNEKYQLRNWDMEGRESLRYLIRRINRIRREHPALHSNQTLRFHSCENDQIIAFSKISSDSGDAIFVVVNLDSYSKQVSSIHVDTAALGIDVDSQFQLRDLVSDARFTWHGRDNYVELEPAMPAHIFQVVR